MANTNGLRLNKLITHPQIVNFMKIKHILSINDNDFYLKCEAYAFYDCGAPHKAIAISNSSRIKRNT